MNSNRKISNKTEYQLKSVIIVKQEIYLNQYIDNHYYQYAVLKTKHQLHRGSLGGSELVGMVDEVEISMS